MGGEGADWWSAAVGVAVIVVLRVLDYLLPQGRHLRIIDRWTHDDEDEKSDGDDK